MREGEGRGVMSQIELEIDVEIDLEIHTEIGTTSHTEGETGGALAAGGIQTLGVLVAFVVFGMGWAQLASGGLAAHPTSPNYPAAVPKRPDPSDLPPEEVSPETWLVDGFNVLHASLLGGRDREEWWTETHREEVLSLARSLTGSGGEIWVVFDGQRPGAEESAEASGVRQVFAPSADEWLLRRVRESPAPGRVAVVTSDRRLASRARHRGALVVSPAEFLARCRSDAGEEERRS